ncbi:hypothetical protein PR048_006431 [Dryococelus australis]|uniref:PiggyBac transposable element-derived protein domain-containing protein n=1 Tax=Dryococelus australis TaxID=614101 RepID=A0ABQ9ICA4_9NEOP|nr:hypothetical protein PR048_006431 [Dryococelus australis]
MPKFSEKLEKGPSPLLRNSTLAVKGHDTKEVECPDAVTFYNKFKGGVDIADEMATLYDHDRKFAKWWKKVFYRLLIISAVIVWIVFRRPDVRVEGLQGAITSEKLAAKSVTTMLDTESTDKDLGITTLLTCSAVAEERNETVDGKSFCLHEVPSPNKRVLFWPGEKKTKSLTSDSTKKFQVLLLLPNGKFIKEKKSSEKKRKEAEKLVRKEARELEISQ